MNAIIAIVIHDESYDSREKQSNELDVKIYWKPTRETRASFDRTLPFSLSSPLSHIIFI